MRLGQNSLKRNVRVWKFALSNIFMSEISNLSGMSHRTVGRRIWFRIDGSGLESQHFNYLKIYYYISEDSFSSNLIQMFIFCPFFKFPLKKLSKEKIEFIGAVLFVSRFCEHYAHFALRFCWRFASNNYGVSPPIGNPNIQRSISLTGWFFVVRNFNK